MVGSIVGSMVGLWLGRCLSSKMMTSDDPCPEFNDLDVDIFMLKVPKQEKASHSAALKKYYTFCRRRTFAAYVASKRAEEGGVAVWHCCGQLFRDAAGVHRHAASLHQGELQRLAEAAFQRQPGPPGDGGLQEDRPVDVCPWIPDTSHLSQEQLQRGPGQVLLYYCYCQVPEPQTLCEWQKALCEKLCLTGKVRVATEGVNGTVGGSCVATALYMQAMRSHWLFTGMEEDDFKSSEGGAACFPDLRVGVFREIVPMGVDPDLLSYNLAGTHLEPEDFHREVETLVSQEGSSSDTILLDCRNFYESKIGHFDRCLAPNIRKFSYFPDYVDQNLELFRDKKVLMYCTGGIRCERGSAYLRSKDVCKEVYQLKGGVHKYLENFPNGFYRGKLFVFDERYAISSNSDVISECRYCDAAWDQYRLCTTQVCRQLVLSCPGCRQRGRTACCPTCQAKGRGQDARGRGQGAPSAGQQPREACECTDRRLRIPQDVL